MKLSSKWLLGLLAALGIGAAAIAASPIQLGGSIFPLTYITTPDLNPTDAFNQMETLVNAQTLAVSQQYQPFATTYNGNPLSQYTVQDIPVASVNATSTGYAFVGGLTGRKIFPGIPVVTVSGTAASATALRILCSPGGNIIATFAVSTLASLIPVFPTSAGYTQGAQLGAGYFKGCASGDSVVASTQGSAMTTTTDVFINLPYTLQ